MLENLSKSTSLDDTLIRFQDALENKNIEIEFSKNYNPISCIHSVHLQHKKFETCYSNGKGTSDKAALASAIGEFIERFSQGFFTDEYHLGMRGDFAFSSREKFVSDVEECLNESLRQFYFDEWDDVAPIDMLDFSSGEDLILTIPFANFVTGKQVFFPVNLLNNLYRSNGMAAGNTFAEAKVQALSEVLERYVKFKVIREGINLPDIPVDVLKSFEGVTDLIREIEQYGYCVYAKDASLGGKFPVINVTILHKETGGVFANFGAHPNMECALIRTLTEIFQGRQEVKFKNLPTPSWSEFEYGSFENLESHFIDGVGTISWNYFKDEPDFAFWNWDHRSSIDGELERLVRIITREGFEIFEFENSPLGIPTVRMVVPGMSEVYSIDDMIEENCNRGRWVYPQVKSMDFLDEESLSDLLDSIEEQGFDDFKSIFSLMGIYTSNKESLEFKVIDLKIAIAIKLQTIEVLEDLSSHKSHGDFYYSRILDGIIGFYTFSEEKFKMLFTKEVQDKVKEAIKDPFAMLNNDRFIEHQELIKLFDKMKI